MKPIVYDPRRKISIIGKMMIPISTLNPGQQCAMKHNDGAWWGPYIVVAHDKGIVNSRLEAIAGSTVVKFEGASWSVPSVAWCFLMDSITEDLRGAKPNGTNSG